MNNFHTGSSPVEFALVALARAAPELLIRERIVYVALNCRGVSRRRAGDGQHHAGNAVFHRGGQPADGIGDSGHAKGSGLAAHDAGGFITRRVNEEIRPTVLLQVSLALAAIFLLEQAEELDVFGIRASMPGHVQGSVDALALQDRHRFLGDIPAAEAAIRRYTELIPDDPNPFDSYAELLLKVGRYGEAIGMYRKALALDPGFTASYVGIACAQMYQDRPVEARAEVEELLRHAHDDGDRRQAYFVSTLTYVEEGKTAEAIGEMEKEFAIAEKAGDAAAMGADLATMAAIRFEAGDVQEAERLYGRAADVVEHSGLADQVKAITRLGNRYNTAMIAAARGASDRAWDEASTMQHDAEALGNTFLTRQAHEAKGRIALLRKDARRAIDELHLASDLNPYNLYRLGLAHRALGEEQEAQRWFKAAAGFNGLPLLNYAFVRARARAALAAN